MINTKVIISESLKNKLSKTWVDTKASELTDGVANAILWNVQEYGFGVGSRIYSYPDYKQDITPSAPQNKTPSGGAPIWQGKVSTLGHYRGYLSESHAIKKINFYQSQIVTPAEFVWGVIKGYSTNWQDSDGNPIIFPENPYHKRAVDKMYREGIITTVWKNAIGR